MGDRGDFLLTGKYLKNGIIEQFTDEKIYSSFVMQLTDSGIDVTITSEDPVLTMVAGETISFTKN